MDSLSPPASCSNSYSSSILNEHSNQACSSQKSNLKGSLLNVSNSFGMSKTDVSSWIESGKYSKGAENLDGITTRNTHKTILDLSPANREILPKVASSMWVGPNKIPPAAVDNVIKFAKSNPETEIRIYLDVGKNTNKADLVKKTGFEGVTCGNIEFIPIRNFMKEPSTFPNINDAYSSFVREGKFAVASDFMRNKILHANGGIYFNMPHEIKGKINWDLGSAAPDEIITDSPHALGSSTGKSEEDIIWVIPNHFLAAQPGCKLLGVVACEQLKKYNELTRIDNRGYHGLGIDSLNCLEIITLVSGSALFGRVLRENDPEYNKQFIKYLDNAKKEKGVGLVRNVDHKFAISQDNPNNEPLFCLFEAGGLGSYYKKSIPFTDSDEDNIPETQNNIIEDANTDAGHVGEQDNNAILAGNPQGRLLGGSSKASEAPSGSAGCTAQGITDIHLPGQGPDDEGSAGAANIITHPLTQESSLETITRAKRHLSESEFKGVIEILKNLCLDKNSVPLLEALAPIEQLSQQQQQKVAVTLLPLLAQRLDNLGYSKNPGPGVGGAISSLLAVLNNMSTEHTRLSLLLYGKNESGKSFSSMLAPYLLYPDFSNAGLQLLHLTNNLVSRQGSPVISTKDIQVVEKAIKKQPLGNEKFREKLLGDFSNFNKAILGKGSARTQRELTVPLNLSPTSIAVAAGQAQLEVDHKVRLDTIKRKDQLNSPAYLYQEEIFNRMKSEKAEKKDSWKMDITRTALRTQSALEQSEIEYRLKNTLKRNTAENQEKSARVTRDQSKAIKKEILRTQSALSATNTSRAIMAHDKARNDEMKSIKAERSNTAYSGSIESRRNANEAISLLADALKDLSMPVHSTNIHQKPGNQALTPFSPVIRVPVAARTVTNQYVPAYLKFEAHDVAIKADIPNAHGTLLEAESITRHGSISTVTLKTPDKKHVEFSGTFKTLDMTTRAGNSNLLSSEWDKGKTNFVTGLSSKLRTPLDQSATAMNAQDMKHFNEANDLKNQRLKEKASMYRESTLKGFTVARPRGYNQPVDTTPVNYNKPVETAPQTKSVNHKVTMGGTGPGDGRSRVGAIAGHATPANGGAQSAERANFAPLTLDDLVQRGQESHLVGGNARNRR